MRVQATVVLQATVPRERMNVTLPADQDAAARMMTAILQQNLDEIVGEIREEYPWALDVTVNALVRVISP